MRFFPLLIIGLISLEGFSEVSAQQVSPMDTNSAEASRPFVEQAPVPFRQTDKTCNQRILDVIRLMPQGGGFSAKKPALDNLRAAVKLDLSAASPELVFTPEVAKPSFCSGATYLVFIGLVHDLLAEKKLQLSTDDLRALLIKGQADGEGVWGRWNANGPGTARLFHELGLGINFQSLDSARPGDFLKVFWNDQIGAKEFGHSVIYLGKRETPEGEVIRIWSSNSGVGFGEKEVPLHKIKRMLFSRLLAPSSLRSISRLPAKDAYLASMLTNSSTEEEMSTMVGIQPDR